MATARSILVIGEHNVGKTNYGVQLFGRLRLSKSRLEMVGSADSVAPFEAGLADLNDGKAPAHTPANANHDLMLPLRLDGQTFSLQWPDYGGEQVSEILRTRSLSDAWQQRIEDADAWLLFLRLAADVNAPDALSRPAPKRPRRGKSGSGTEAPKSMLPRTTTDVQWNSNARAIEILQMLLHAKRVSVRRRVKSPPLAIVLTCWDELGTPGLPGDELARRLPMLHAFVTATWDSHAFEVFGLSSLGGSLAVPEVSEKHRDMGPEMQGFIVGPSGQQSSDLAEPVVWLLEQLS